MKIDPTKYKILIVDDAVKNIQLLGNVLAAENFNVEFAMNGEEALNWIADEQFDLILLDIMMPEMDGFEVCKRIREADKNAKVPIIFLTAKTDKESVLRGFDLGAQDYVTKPFDSRELMARVRTQIELKTNREKLEQMNQMLEEKVEDRTQELAEANKKLEKHNVELVDMDAAKSEFLNILSQKIRTPLTNIMASIHILKGKVETRELTDLINNLDESVEDMEKFTSIAVQITTFRIKKQSLDLEEINIRHILEYSYLQVHELIKENQIELDYSMIPDDISITGDFDLLMTCFQYLFEKLAKASSRGDSIVVTAIKKEEMLGCSFLNNDGGYSEDFIQEIGYLNSGVASNVTSLNDWELLLANLVLEVHSGRLEPISNKNEIKLIFMTNS